MNFFDAQLRSDTRSDDDLKNLAYFGTVEVVTSAHARRPFSAAPDLIAYLTALATDECDRLEHSGITAHAALGVLPEAQPGRLHHELWRELPKLLQLPKVVALGEIGVSSDVATEWELFDRQMRFAADAGLPLIITPPETLHVNMVYKMMRRIERQGIEPKRVLFNRLDERTISTVLDEGFFAGVSAGAGLGARGASKLIVSEVERRQSVERIILNSSLQEGGADVLAVPKAIAELASAWSENKIFEVVQSNPRAFYGLYSEQRFA